MAQGTRPDQVPHTLQIWVKADSLLTSNRQPSDGAQVDTMYNWGTIGGQFVQATAGNRPLFVTKATYSAKSAVRFDGSNDALTATAALSNFKFIHDGTTSWTIIAAYQHVTKTATSRIFDTAGTSSGGSGMILYAMHTDDFSYMQLYKGTGASIFNIQMSNNIKNKVGTLLIMVIRLDISFATDSMYVMIDGTTINRAGATNTPYSSADASSAKFGNATSGALDGYLQEFVVYSGLLTDNQVSDVSTYLRAKWETFDTSATNIYRSIKPSAGGAGAALATGAGNNLRVSNDTCYFASALPNDVGVGMVLQYDGNNDAAITTSDTLAFFKKRVSSTVFLGQTRLGGRPMPTAAADQDWSIFAGYTSMGLMNSLSENTNIDADLRNFDTAVTNLKTANKIWNIACYAGIDSGGASITIDDWTTARTDYFRIYTPYLTTEAGTSQRHNRVRSSSCYVLVMNAGISASNGLQFGASASADVMCHVRVEGLYIKFMGTDAIVALNASGINGTNIMADVRFVGNVVEGVTSANGGHVGIKADATEEGSSVLIANNIVFGFVETGTVTGIGIEVLAGVGGEAHHNQYFYNNTVVGCNGGFSVANIPHNYTKNCLYQAGGAASPNGYATTSFYESSSTNNLSDQASDCPGSNPQDSKTVTFVGGNDYGLDAADASAKNLGATLTSDADVPTSNWQFAYDVQNETRTGTWDIGADEFVSTAVAPHRRVIVIGMLLMTAIGMILLKRGKNEI